MILKNAYTTSYNLRWWLGREPAEDAVQAPSGQMPHTEFLDVSSLGSSDLRGELSISRIKPLTRIHILGAGNTGRFVAHALAGIPDRPPITLIFRGATMLSRWKERGCSIEVVTDGYGETRRGFDTEVLQPQEREPFPSTFGFSNGYFSSADQQSDSNASLVEPDDSEKIHQLILSIKAPFVVKALSQVAHRLSRESTILFFPNGMGVLDEVNKHVFPDESKRPTYVNGLFTHMLQASDSDSFAVVHAGMGTIALGILPRHTMLKSWTESDMISRLSPSARYLVRSLTRIPVLAAVGFAPTDMFQLLVEKLIVNAVIGPLTVVFNCSNGELLHNKSITKVIRLLIAEISLVVRSLPELQGVPNVTMRFAPERLEALVVNNCITTPEYTSPMLRDIKVAMLTEIEYLSGYIVRRGEELGIKCLMNYIVLHIVKGKGILQSKRNSQLLPVEYDV